MTKHFLQGFTPVIYCQNLDLCLEFYKETLNFVIIRERHAKAALEWVHLKSGDVWIMLEKSCEVTHSGGHEDIQLYFYCTDAKLSRHFIIARGYKPGELEYTNWNTKEFSLRDPEGRMLKICERLHMSGY